MIGSLSNLELHDDEEFTVRKHHRGGEWVYSFIYFKRSMSAGVSYTAGHVDSMQTDILPLTLEQLRQKIYRMRQDSRALR